MVELFQMLARESGAPDYLSTIQYLDTRSYLPQDILTKLDYTSMMVSLEARVPLLDHVLMEFLASMPSRFKLRGQTGKYLLKRVMTDLLPSEVLTRNGLRVAARAGSKRARRARPPGAAITTGRHGLINLPAVEAVLRDHQSGRATGQSRSGLCSAWALVSYLVGQELSTRWRPR
jgi:asparagine synthase (glutamine-hydrolysing)